MLQHNNFFKKKKKYLFKWKKKVLKQITDVPSAIFARTDLIFRKQGVLTKITSRLNKNVLLLLFSDFFIYAERSLKTSFSASANWHFGYESKKKKREWKNAKDIF